MDSSLSQVRTYLKALIDPPESEIVHCLSRMSVTKVKAGNLFFKDGDLTSSIGFNLNGLLYSYYTDLKGKLYVKKFHIPGQPLACYPSLLNGTPAHYSCEALQDSQIATLKYSDLKSFYSRHICWEKLGRLTAERLYLEKELREKQFLTDDAQTRYLAFQKNHGDLAKVIPQYLVASYIGVTPVALSRIKKRTF